MILDIILAIIGSILLLVGLIGCIIPFIPGPPAGYLGLLFIQWSGYGGFSASFLIKWAIIVLIVTVIDFYLPVWMTRKFGGSRYAKIGSMVGLVAGFFLFPPLGIVICPFFGALIGELIHDSAETTKAIRVAMGAFAAFMLGTGFKLIISGILLFYGIRSFFV